MNTEDFNEHFSEVRSTREVRGLAHEIFSRERDYPIIGLTARPGEQRPPLSGARIRQIVGPGTSLYFVASYDAALMLSYFLPRCLAVNRGAARLWWPGVDKHSKPEEHPRFYDVRGCYQEQIYDWLEGEFRPPLTPYLAPVRPCRSTRGVRLTGQPPTERGAGVDLTVSMNVLAHFVDGRAMGHQEVAQHADISRSMAARCLIELTALGYLTETRERGYRLAGALQRLRSKTT